MLKINDFIFRRFDSFGHYPLQENCNTKVVYLKLVEVQIWEQGLSEQRTNNLPAIAIVVLGLNDQLNSQFFTEAEIGRSQAHKLVVYVILMGQ